MYDFTSTSARHQQGCITVEGQIDSQGGVDLGLNSAFHRLKRYSSTKTVCPSCSHDGRPALFSPAVFPMPSRPKWRQPERRHGGYYYLLEASSKRASSRAKISRTRIWCVDVVHILLNSPVLLPFSRWLLLSPPGDNLRKAMLF